MIQIEHNRIRNHNRQKAAPRPVGYLQEWPRIWTRDDQQVNRAGIEPGTASLRVWHAEQSAALPININFE